MRALIYGAGIAGLTLTLATARGVTLPQFRMLVVLVAGPTNLSGLAAALDVAPSTATRMVDRLVEQAWYSALSRRPTAGRSPSR